MITRCEVDKIYEEQIKLRNKLLNEIKSIVSEQQNKTIDVVDMYAIIGYDFETSEEQITQLSIGEYGELIIKTINGSVLNEDDVCYRTDSYLDMLSVLLTHFE